MFPLDLTGFWLKLRGDSRLSERPQPDASVLYVPPPTAADAIIEAIENEIGVDCLHYRRYPSGGRDSGALQERWAFATTANAYDV